MELGLRETDRWVQPRAVIAAWKWGARSSVLAVGKALAMMQKAAKRSFIERTTAKLIKSCSR